jgi:hypothetical protein
MEMFHAKCFEGATLDDHMHFNLPSDIMIALGNQRLQSGLYALHKGLWLTS